MRGLFKTVAAALAISAAATTHAAAEVCVLFICLGGGGSGSGGGSSVPAAPEIDVTQGLAAVAVLACAAMFLRERFLRQR